MVAWIVERSARLALVLCVLGTLAGCGSGAVGSPPSTTPPGPISITPSTATVFSGVPTTFLVSGGSPPYVVTSDNQSVIAFTPNVAGTTLTIVPGDVATDTTVTMTVRDTAGSTPATATLTVKARTLSNVVTITPSASQSAACGTAVCAGGDAEVKVTLTQAGIPLANRPVRFDVVSGDFLIITGSSNGTETTATSGTAVTDSTGTARIRVRALNGASSQTALLQITDVSSGSTLRTSFAIAASTNAALNAQPSELHFTGPDASSCANGISADVIVFGGQPPYSISNPGTFNVNPLILHSSGDRFTVTANGQCTAATRIAIVDASGATVTVNATNELGTAVQTPPLVVSPTTVQLTSCSDVATVTIGGGQGPGTYFGASGSAAVFVSTAGNFGFIRRQGGTNALALPTDANGNSTVTVSFSDGRSAVPVTVQLIGSGANSGRGAC